MFEEFGEAVKKEFSVQLRRYREHATLSQEEFGDFFGISRSSITSHERGSKAIGIDRIEVFARAFGIRYFQMADPQFEMPPLEKMSPPFRKYIEQVWKAREEKIQENELKKEEGENLYQLGRSKQLHAAIESGFFKRDRTAKEAFFYISGQKKGEELTTEQKLEVSRITSTLSSGRFVNLLDKLEPRPGTSEVRFIEKSANNIPYLSEPGSSRDMAAEEG